MKFSKLYNCLGHCLDFFRSSSLECPEPSFIREAEYQNLFCTERLSRELFAVCKSWHSCTQVANK